MRDKSTKRHIPGAVPAWSEVRREGVGHAGDIRGWQHYPGARTAKHLLGALVCAGAELSHFGQSCIYFLPNPWLKSAVNPFVLKEKN